MNRRRLFGSVIVAGVAGVLGLMVLANTTIRTGCGGGKAREAVLRTDLRTFRDVIEQFRSDRGAYPPNLEALVTQGYLRMIPVDPMTTSTTTWVPVLRSGPGEKQVVNVRSGSLARGSDGRRYAEW